MHGRLSKILFLKKVFGAAFRGLCAFLLFSTLVLFLGCRTQPHRARQYKRAFSGLAEEQKERLHAGRIALQDTREMVYIALGTPKQTRKLPLEFGEYGEVWLYLGYLADEAPQSAEELQFVTLNDFIWASPFEPRPLQLLTLEFIDSKLHCFDWRSLAPGEHFKQELPLMTLPQIRGSSSVDEHDPDD